MREDRSPHAGIPAPAELLGDARMPDERGSSRAEERPLERGAVADVDADGLEQPRALLEASHIRHVKHAGSAGKQLEPDGRSGERVLHGPGLD